MYNENKGPLNFKKRCLDDV